MKLMLERGFIRPSKSPYGAPVFFVRKAAVAYLGQGLGGFANGKSSWGSGGRCEPPSGVRGSGPENFQNIAF